MQELAVTECRNSKSPRADLKGTKLQAGLTMSVKLGQTVDGINPALR